MKKKAVSTKKKKKTAVKAKAKTALKRTAKSAKKKKAAPKAAKKATKKASKKKKAAASRTAKAAKKASSKTKIKKAAKSRKTAQDIRAEKAKKQTMDNRGLQTASGASKKQPNPAKGPKLADPRSKESVSGQAAEPVLNDPSVPQGAPIPEATAEGVAPHGIPYKPDDYVSQRAMNEEAEHAQALRRPRGTSTHTYASPGHSRDSSGRK